MAILPPWATARKEQSYEHWEDLDLNLNLNLNLNLGTDTY